jgi:hypothetical protein
LSKGPIKATLEIKSQPGGLHLEDTRNFSTVEISSSKGIIKKKTINSDIEENNMEQFLDGNRYLEYNSVSGKDLVPRIR